MQPQQTLCPSAQLLRGAEAGSLPAQSRALALSLDASHTGGHPAGWFARSEVTPSAYGSGEKPGLQERPLNPLQGMAVLRPQPQIHSEAAAQRCKAASVPTLRRGRGHSL